MKAPKKSTKRLYVIPVLSKSLDILELLQKNNQPMSLEAIYQQTGISKTTVYRILKTLVHRGYLSQGQDGRYRHTMHPRKLVFGFGSESADLPFSVAVTESLRAAAFNVGVDLVVLDNSYDARTAVENIDEFIKKRVDLIIEFQVDQQVAAIIADKVANASIPMIAVDIPHPNSIYFGVNNFRVGYSAGELLATHAINAWRGRADWVLGLDLEAAGSLVQSRITGLFEGVRSNLERIPVEAFVRMDGRGLRDVSHRLVREFLKRHPDDKFILIGAATDTSALGAWEAAQELKREKHVAIVGHDCIPEMLEVIKKPRSSVLGSVLHDTALYGSGLIHLGMAMLKGQTVPPYNYVEHELITRETLLAQTKAVG